LEVHRRQQQIWQQMNMGSKGNMTKVGQSVPDSDIDIELIWLNRYCCTTAHNLSEVFKSAVREA
jgi:hypothetical protein